MRTALAVAIVASLAACSQSTQTTALAQVPNVVQAMYGLPHQGANVTAVVQGRCTSATGCTVPVNNDTFGGDPAPGKPNKLLGVVWRCLGGKITKSSITPEHGAAFLVCNDPPPAVERPLSVIYATWGPERVTEKAKQLCPDGSFFCQMPALETFFPDTSPGNVKRLTITYVCQGQSRIETVSENGLGNLSCT